MICSSSCIPTRRGRQKITSTALLAQARREMGQSENHRVFWCSIFQRWTRSALLAMIEKSIDKNFNAFDCCKSVVCLSSGESCWRLGEGLLGHRLGGI